MNNIKNTAAPSTITLPLGTATYYQRVPGTECELMLACPAHSPFIRHLYAYEIVCVGNIPILPVKYK